MFLVKSHWPMLIATIFLWGALVYEPTMGFCVDGSQSVKKYKYNYVNPVFMSSGNDDSTGGNSFKVAASVLDGNASEEERQFMNVFRRCSPSVVYVTSTVNKNQGLGSGTGFVVHPAGYILTNFHVIERAYNFIQLEERMNNLTQSCPLLPNNNRNTTVDVKVRLNDSKEFQTCRIVDVRPEIDMAVLQIINDNNNKKSSAVVDDWPILDYGVSSKLLVGQRVLALGNPFGLEQTLTVGIVSALNRDVTTSSNQTPIPNCIQTDAAINPGNSGGPLLDTSGRVIGMNTAIITTSGSNAGIGFAVPIDRIKEEATGIISKDYYKTPTLGLQILKTSSPLHTLLQQKTSLNKGVFVSSSTLNDIRPFQLTTPSSPLVLGDAIVAMNGTFINNSDELQQQFRKLVPGEQINLTVENTQTNERRIVYITVPKQ